MRKTYIVLMVIVLAGAGLYAYSRLSQPAERVPGEDTIEKAVGWKEYSSDKHGLRFLYPDKYFLEEKTADNGLRYHDQIILTEDTEENRAVREGRAPGREGPVAITVDIYQNDLDKLSPEAWMKTTNVSNYKLSNGLYATTSVDGHEGVAYRWSGLYEGDTVAVSSGKSIYAFAVTYLTEDAEIRSDFAKILGTVKLR